MVVPSFKCKFLLNLLKTIHVQSRNADGTQSVLVLKGVAALEEVILLACGALVAIQDTRIHTTYLGNALQEKACFVT